MDADRAHQLVEAGLWLRLSGDTAGARQLFERALEVDPSNRQARAHLDRLLWQQSTPTAVDPSMLPFTRWEQPASASVRQVDPGPWHAATKIEVIPPMAQPASPRSQAPRPQAPRPQAPRPAVVQPPVAQPSAPKPPVARPSAVKSPPPASAWAEPVSGEVIVTLEIDMEDDAPDVLAFLANDAQQAPPPPRALPPSRLPPKPPPFELETLLQGVQELLALDDHSSAMHLLEQAEKMAPGDARVVAARERSERTLLSMFESKLGDMQRRPRVKMKPDEVIWLNLDHRAGFLLAQIDGHSSYEDLFLISGMSRLDTARILVLFLEQNITAHV